MPVITEKKMFLSPDISGLIPSLVTKLVRKAIDVDEFPSLFTHITKSNIAFIAVLHLTITVRYPIMLYWLDGSVF